MAGRAFRRVPVSASFLLPFLPNTMLLRGFGLIALCLAALSTAGAAELTPWQASAPPALTLEALDGDSTSLNDLDDSVVVVHFFATWCEPCRRELSALERLSQRFEGRPLAILAVDSGEPEVRVRRFFREFPVSFPVLLDGDRAALKAWGVTTFPTSFIVGGGWRPLIVAEGEVAWDGDEVATVIAKLLDAGEGPLAQPPNRATSSHKPEGDVQ
jgi:thiol-disulfide isomerase/thioredoxin